MNSIVPIREAVLGAVGDEWETARDIAKRLDRWSVQYVRDQLQFLARRGQIWRMGEVVSPLGVTHKFCRIRSDLPDLVIG